MYIENIDLFYQSLSKSRPYHIDNCYEFHYIAQGKGVFDVAGKSNIIKEGDFFFTLPPEKHRLIFKTVNENIMQYLIRIHLDKNDADLKTYIETILLKQRFFHIGTHHKYFFENFKQLFKSNILLNQKSALYQFIGFLYTLGNIKTSFKNPKYILYLEQALKSMYESVDQNLNMREISDKLGINLSYFIRIFKNTLGVPPKQYFLNLKLEKAVYYLLNSNLKIYQITNKLNFSNEFHFSKLFKQNKGISPVQYRQQYSG